MDKTLYRNTMNENRWTKVRGKLHRNMMNENRKNDRESDNKVEREICVGR